MGNWESLDAGGQLDQLAAERVGYRVGQVQVGLVYDCYLYAPDGNSRLVDENTTNEQMWAFALATGYIPHYSRDVTAATSLIPVDLDHWVIVSWSLFHIARINVLDDNGDIHEYVGYATGETPEGRALAITRAAMAYADAIGDEAFRGLFRRL